MAVAGDRWRLRLLVRAATKSVQQTQKKNRRKAAAQQQKKNKQKAAQVRSGGDGGAGQLRAASAIRVARMTR